MHRSIHKYLFLPLQLSKEKHLILIDYKYFHFLYIEAEILIDSSLYV